MIKLDRLVPAEDASELIEFTSDMGLLALKDGKAESADLTKPPAFLFNMDSMLSTVGYRSKFQMLTLAASIESSPSTCWTANAEKQAGAWLLYSVLQYMQTSRTKRRQIDECS